MSPALRAQVAAVFDAYWRGEGSAADLANRIAALLAVTAPRCDCGDLAAPGARECAPCAAARANTPPSHTLTDETAGKLRALSRAARLAASPLFPEP